MEALEGVRDMVGQTDGLVEPGLNQVKQVTLEPTDSELMAPVDIPIKRATHLVVVVAGLVEHQHIKATTTTVEMEVLQKSGLLRLELIMQEEAGAPLLPLELKDWVVEPPHQHKKVVVGMVSLREREIPVEQILVVVRVEQTIPLRVAQAAPVLSSSSTPTHLP